MRSAVTISLVPEAAGGPFVFTDGLADGFARAARLGFHAVEIFPPSAEALDARLIKSLCAQHQLKIAAIGTGAGWVKHKLRLTDPDPALRRRALSFIVAIVDLAGSFGAPAILGSMQGRWPTGHSAGCLLPHALHRQLARHRLAVGGQSGAGISFTNPPGRPGTCPESAARDSAAVVRPASAK